MNTTPTAHRRQTLLSALCIASLVTAAPASAAVIDSFTKIDGIPGDSLNARHPGEIALTSYSQSFGGRNCSRVVANKILDSASPALFSSAATNVTIPSVIIRLVKNSSSGSVDFFKATLDTVQIERIELGDQNSALVEQVVLRPRNIRIEYRTQDNAGN